MQIIGFEADTYFILSNNFSYSLLSNCVFLNLHSPTSSIFFTFFPNKSTSICFSIFINDRHLATCNFSKEQEIVRTCMNHQNISEKSKNYYFIHTFRLAVENTRNDGAGR